MKKVAMLGLKSFFMRTEGLAVILKMAIDVSYKKKNIHTMKPKLL